MDAQQFLDNFATIAESPGGVQRLRDLVLDLAISGRLVEQEPADEPVALLIERIEADRRTRNGPTTTATSSSGSFEIPVTWIWLPLERLVHLEMGQSPPSSEYNQLGDGMAFFQGKADFGRDFPVPRYWCTAPTKVAQPGDVLISVRAPVGPTNIADQECCVGRGLAALRPLGGVPTRFIRYLMQAFERDLAALGTGTTFIAISKKVLGPFPVPVPPLAEQERIVAKVDELMGLCDDLEARQQHRHRATTHFRASALHALIEAESPDDLPQAWDRADASWGGLLDSVEAVESLRKAVLELATTGRFDVGSADQWTRCALGEQITLQRGFDITKSQQRPGPYPVVSSGGILSHHSEAACDGPGVVIGRKGSVGRVHWVPEHYWPHDTTLWVKDFHGNDPEYVFWFLKSFPLLDYESSTANPSLNRNRLHPVEVVWPERSLQPELVDRVKRIFALCDRAEVAVRRQDAAASACASALTQV